MNRDLLHTLLSRVGSGELSPEAAADHLSNGAGASALLNGYIETDGAVVDTDRDRRCGIPEVIYCESKRPEQIIEVARILLERHGLAFGTRCRPEQAAALREAFPEAEYHETARTIRIGTPQPRRTDLVTAVVAAGTSDLSVSEEAAITLETFGAPVERVSDVGVAGVHRLLARRETLERAGVVIVVAGMEGALPSVVGGMTRRPLIAVPTSVGYGAAMGGFTPLFGMLTSCASGITVVNIDNGFGAAAAALRIIDAVGSFEK